MGNQPITFPTGGREEADNGEPRFHLTRREARRWIRGLLSTMIRDMEVQEEPLRWGGSQAEWDDLWNKVGKRIVAGDRP